MGFIAESSLDRIRKLTARAFDWKGWRLEKGPLVWALLVFMVGSLASLWVYRDVQRELKESLKQEFDFRANEVAARIQTRLENYQQVLRGGVGLWDAKGEVSRADWHAYVERLNVFEAFPGILSVGFSEAVRPEDLDTYLHGVRSEGYPTYTIHPVGQRPLYSAVRYLEPPSFAAENSHVFGFDMYADSTRRRAMQLAVDTSGVGLSAKVQLITKGATHHQAGFLLYHPVFRQGADHSTPEARQSALRGWVYAPFYAQDFIEGVMGGWYRDKGAAAVLEVYDGLSLDKASRLYSGIEGLGQPAHDGRFHAHRVLSIAGHNWTIYLESRPAFEARLESDVTWQNLLAGVFLSALLGVAVWLIGSARARAVRLATRISRQVVESEARFRQLGDTAPLKMFSSDRESATIWFNQDWCNFLGCIADMEHESGRALLRSRLHPGDVDMYVGIVNAAKDRGEAYRVEYRILDVKGQVVWLYEVGAPRLIDGSVRGYVACSVDITEDKRLDEAVKAKSDELRAIFMSVPDGVVVVNDQAQVIRVNPRFLQMTGFAEHELMGQRIEQLLPVGQRERHRQMTESYMYDPRPRGMGVGQELKARRADGREFPVEVSLSPVEIDGQRCVIGVLRDVTEQAMVRQSLRDATEQAQGANRAKSEFLANMSHEIRTPLNGILGMAELVLMDDISTTHRKHLETLESSAFHLLDIVNEVLDISKIEAGQLHIDKVPFRLSNVIDDVMGPLQMQARQKDITLSVEVAVDVPDHLSGDPLRLRQVLSNLLNNALKFTPQGSIDLLVDCVTDAAAGRCVLYCSVKDSGIGIPLVRQDAIFEKFEQVDASTTRRYGGTGLGLAICKQLMELMGGRITVVSSEGVGSVFQFNVPFDLLDVSLREPGCRLAMSERQAGNRYRISRRTMSTVATGAPALRILLADDSLANRITVRAMLERHGHDVSEVENGAEAVRVALHGHFDLILMDMQMPEMDGLEATQLIRAGEKNGQRVPILALTANAMAKDRDRCLQAGMDDYLTKPIAMSRLIKAVNSVGEKVSSRPQLDRMVPVTAVAEVSGAELDGRAVPNDQVAQLLEKVDQDVELALGMISACLGDLDGRVQAIEQALQTVQLQSLSRAAHALKGLVAMFGEGDLRQLAAEMESKAKANQEDEVRRLCETLGEATKTFKLDLLAMRDVIEHMQPARGGHVA